VVNTMIHMLSSVRDQATQARIHPVRSGYHRLFRCLTGEQLANTPRGRVPSTPVSSGKSPIGRSHPHVRFHRVTVICKAYAL
jgi:hypothetical protein